jgi:hypothetical protein
MKREARGAVEARVGIAPEHAMRVKEEFVRRMRDRRGTYQAEWTMTLKSLRPQRWME